MELRPVLKLEYDPVAMRYRAPDSVLERQLLSALKVKVPPQKSFGAHPAKQQDEWVEFYDRTEKRILTGLLPTVQAWAQSAEVDLELSEWPEDEPPEIDEKIVPGITLEDYQLEAARRCLRDWRGVLEMVMGAGKTETSIAVVLALGIPPTVYVVPDVSSMHQTYERFLKRGFTKRQVGRFGDQYAELKKPVLICCVASLYSGLKRGHTEVLELLQNAEVLFLDEVHHQATAFSWQTVASSCRARRRYGMSGTPYKDSRSRDDTFLHYQDGWLRGYTGSTLIYVSPSQLQDRGRLSACRILFFDGGGRDLSSWDWHTVYKLGVIDNTSRNRRIALLVENLVYLGKLPLVSVEKLRHGRILQRMLLDRGVLAACSYGQGVLIIPEEALDGLLQDYPALEVERVPLMDDDGKPVDPVEYEDGYCKIPVDMNAGKLLKAGNIHAIIGSRIYDEALDIPHLTDLVNAAAGRASQRLRQKIGRILRLFDGKTIATVWDVWDTCHPWLTAQSKARWRTAAEEKYFVYDGSRMVETRVPVIELSRCKGFVSCS